MIILNKIALYSLFGLSLIACRGENKEEILQIENEKYKLSENKIKNLSLFSANFGIREIDIIKNTNNSYDIKTIRFVDTNNQIEEKFTISISGDNLKITTVYLSINYLLEKKENKVFFVKEKDRKELTEDFIQSIDKKDEYILKRLMSLYVELYDKSIKKLGKNTENIAMGRMGLNGVEFKTHNEVKDLRCAKFETSIGLTSTAARLRADFDAKEYISNGHSDCRVEGTDVSCLLDAHICVATTTISCGGNSCN